jgi:imidazoleglycerol-phosphate dehydratase
MSRITRKTKETQVAVEIGDGLAGPTIDTTAPFLDHMLGVLARYAGLSMRVSARGDLRHHVVEDVAITLGEALRRRTPVRCARYGTRTIPMDDALVQVAIDLGGRAFFGGSLPSRLYEHWMRSFADAARLTLHVRVIRGRDRHHVVEAAFKALGLALRAALVEGDAVFSTKGTVEWEVE